MEGYQYFTFGYGHYTPGDLPLRNVVVRVEGDFTEARRKLVSVVGEKFAFQYDTAESAGVSDYGLTVLDFDDFKAYWE